MCEQNGGGRRTYGSDHSNDVDYKGDSDLPSVYRETPIDGITLQQARPTSHVLLHTDSICVTEGIRWGWATCAVTEANNHAS